MSNIRLHSMKQTTASSHLNKLSGLMLLNEKVAIVPFGTMWRPRSVNSLDPYSNMNEHIFLKNSNLKKRWRMTERPLAQTRLYTDKELEEAKPLRCLPPVGMSKIPRPVPGSMKVCD